MTSPDESERPRPRRSVLFVPASNRRALEKVPSLACDAVILDLEDAVAPEAKVEARSTAASAIEGGSLSGKEVIVRVNGFGTPWLAEDLIAVAAAEPDAILFPKITDREHVHRAEEALSQAYAVAKTRLWLMVETAQAALHVGTLAAEAAQPHSRLDCLVLGTSDLAMDLRLTVTPSRLALLQALSTTVMAARAYGLSVLDGVFTMLSDPDGFADECRQGRALGFDGKTLIHPSQIDTANALFAPTAAEIDNAIAIVTAFTQPDALGKAVLVVDGRMIEWLHYEAAVRLLRLAEAVAERP